MTDQSGTFAIFPFNESRALLRRPPPAITQEMIVEATLGRDAIDMPAVVIRFTPEGAERLAKLTRDNVGSRIAVVVDGEVVADPLILEAIPDGEVQIGFGEEFLAYAIELAARLNAANAK